MSLADRTPPTTEEYDSYRERFKNWGRWGANDELGTLNHVTDATRLAAAALVRTGRVVSCAEPLATTPGPRNPNPAQHFMRVTPTASLDYIGVFYHGWTNTHIDALCHIFAADGSSLYDGRPTSAVTSTGATTCSVENWRDGIVTRGVLYDIPRFRGKPFVDHEAPVHGWELADCARAEGVEPRPGDAVLVRSGKYDYLAANPDAQIGAMPGVHASALEFLHAHDAALLAWDLQEAADQGYSHRIPIHAIAIPYMGLPLLDNANFDRLAATCAELGRWEFQFVVAPLVVVGGTGSPVNPLAVF
jgi:kynurenine formamidase